MESKELKFVLKLLGCTEYRSLVSASIFDSFKQDKTKICRALSDRGLIDFEREITNLRITSAGKNVLKMDMTKLPISPVEYKLLQVLLKAGGKLIPSQIKGMKNVKVAERDRLVQSLAERGLVAMESGMKRQKCEVWITEAGLNYLRNEFTGSGTQAVISLDLLSNYLQFMRKSVDRHQSTQKVTPNQKPTDEGILETIRELGRVTS
ncbi:transcription factor RcaD [Merismopedia glauca]|uniref:Transcription factor RcaD n=1 Tax=Merismopedia glauca CCAP 1448/3 TaxID=1296344 RepID=A0A2T1C332_9CYAN|nr:transcription factor RcaD [Merismopedia glauca]PSB02614.1 transcription factor RcaD [Merismopedia glauca CCAP 1448/3]